MAQIIIKEYGTKIFQRDFSRTEDNLIALINDMSKKGIISLSEFKKVFNDSFDETIEVFTEALVEHSENITNKVIK